jgi:hypothetical protein
MIHWICNELLFEGHFFSLLVQSPILNGKATVCRVARGRDRATLQRKAQPT